MGSQFFWEIIIVFVLTLLNGFFAGSEIALISLRKGRVNELAKRFPQRAKIIKDLQSDPETFIATTQIGISVITIVASAFAGTRLASHIAPYFQSIPALRHQADLISFVLIVIFVSYITLVFGELVPKSLALRSPERFALVTSYPVYWISRVASPLIKFLTFSSNLVLAPFKDSTSFMESKMSEEELRILLQEGQKAGTIEPREHQILENVFEFSDTVVEHIMTSAAHITALDIGDPVQANVARAVESEYSRIPVYEGDINNVVGILNVKDLLPFIGKDLKEINIRSLLLPPLFVPTTQKISDLLQKFQKKKMHIALVTDEHGQVDGLVTLEDVLEEIVGEISDETDEVKRDIIRQKNGAYRVEGTTLIVDFNRYFKTDIPDDDNFTTISGYILDSLSRFPESGDVITYRDLEFRVIEKTDRMIQAVSVQRAGRLSPAKSN
jgi:magnesium and cobalt exporter, CNNM family